MNIIFLVLATAALVAADQLSKLWALNTLAPIHSIPIIEGVFELMYTENRGAAFGILQGFRWGFLVLTLPVVIMIVGLYIKLGRYRLSYRIALTMMLSGALGNAIDRLFRGFVVDFFYFKLINFAVFNVADSLLVCGTILFAVILLFVDKGKNYA